MSLQNTHIVITGKLSEVRNDFEDIIIANGGVFKTSVSNSTDYLVMGEKPGKTKVSKAKQLGVPVITETELLNKIYH